MAVERKGRVEGKAALITGAAGGLGAAMAWMLGKPLVGYKDDFRSMITGHYRTSPGTEPDNKDQANG